MRILLLSILVALAAQGQLDPGNHDLFQDRQKVGEVFVPPRAVPWGPGYRYVKIEASESPQLPGR